MTTNAQPVQAIARVKSIFEINTDYIELADLLDELGGELTPEIEERLKINREELEAKVKAYVHLIRVRESNITAVDNEIARLSLLKQTYENTIKKLKSVLLDTTKLHGYRGKSGNFKLDFDTVKLYTKDSKSTEIDDLEEIPEKYRKYSITGKLTHAEHLKIIEALSELKNRFIYEPDKTSIKDDINQSIEVPGAHIETKSGIRF